MASAGQFEWADWAVIAAYFAVVIGLGAVLSRRGAPNAQDYFLAGRAMPIALITFSVLATTQSAATFLGGPDTGFRGDYTYLTSFLGAIVASILVAVLVLPRLYGAGVSTVYEYLDRRYGPRAMRAAGAMYLVGRVFANGARLFMAALAVAMILFGAVNLTTIVAASAIITLIGLVLTISGGLRAVVASDALQFVVYVGAALVILAGLWQVLDVAPATIVEALRNTPEGQNKLTFVDASWRLDDPFTLPAILTGVTLLYLANFGLDQDTTQRLLAAKDARRAGLALLLAALLTIPIVFIFISLGQGLYLLYERPDIIAARPALMPEEGVRSVTVFMHYILTELPAGLKGLAAAGVLAAAVSTLNSGLNSMASVAVADFYRPWAGPAASAHDDVVAGRVAMGVMAALLFAMSVLCYVWQQSSDIPLLQFALQVMTFAYAGLLGVFATALLTRRGSETSVIAGLVVGFVLMVVSEPAIGAQLGVPDAYLSAAFSWKLLVGALVAFAVSAMGLKRAASGESTTAGNPSSAA